MKCNSVVKRVLVWLGDSEILPSSLALVKKAQKMKRGQYGVYHQTLLLLTHHSLHNTHISSLNLVYQSGFILQHLPLRHFSNLVPSNSMNIKKCLIIQFHYEPHEKEYQERKFLRVLTIYNLSYQLGLNVLTDLIYSNIQYI